MKFVPNFISDKLGTHFENLRTLMKLGSAHISQSPQFYEIRSDDISQFSQMTEI